MTPKIAISEAKRIVFTVETLFHAALSLIKKYVPLAIALPASQM